MENSTNIWAGKLCLTLSYLRKKSIDMYCTHALHAATVTQFTKATLSGEGARMSVSRPFLFIERQKGTAEEGAAARQE